MSHMVGIAYSKCYCICQFWTEMPSHLPIDMEKKIDFCFVNSYCHFPLWYRLSKTHNCDFSVFHDWYKLRRSPDHKMFVKSIPFLRNHSPRFALYIKIENWRIDWEQCHEMKSRNVSINCCWKFCTYITFAFSLKMMLCSVNALNCMFEIVNFSFNLSSSFRNS